MFVWGWNGSGMKVCRPQQPTVWTTWRGRSGTPRTQLQRQRHHRLVALGGASTLSCWKLSRWLPLQYPSVQGAPAEKLTVGMPTFGHGWELMDESEVIYWNQTIWNNGKYFPRTDCSAWQQETAHAGRTLDNLDSSDITRSCKLSTMTRESGKLLLEYCQKIVWDDVLHSFKIYTVCLGCLEQLLRLGRQLWMDAILLLTSQMDLGKWTTKNNCQGGQEIWTQATSFRWVGYDDVDSIRLKAQFVNSRGLAGSMIW